MSKTNPQTKDLPKYLWLKERIKKQIEFGELKSGQRVPSENELVHTYGLSNNTVQKAFTHLFLEGYIYREQGKGTFVKESKIREREINIQVICNHSSSIRDSNPPSWFVNFYILQGIVDGCSKFNCKPNFVDPHSEDFSNNKSQAVIALQSGPEIIEKLERKDYIVVLPYNAPSELKCSKVIVDRKEAAYKGVTHLLNLGHRRIAYLGGVFYPRCQGYRKALKEKGFLREEYIRRCSKKEKDIYESIIFLLNLKERPTAIFTSADLIALGVMKVIREKGLSIPEDIAIVSYDDIPEASNCQPPLTTLHPPRYECGYESVRLLRQLINKEKQEPQTIILPTKLIIRKSCGAYSKL